MRIMLIQDLFTSSYPPLAAAVPGWQYPPHGMAYGMQYHPSVMVNHILKLLPNLNHGIG